MCEYVILDNSKMDKCIYDENNGIWYELQGDSFTLGYPTETLSTLFTKAPRK